METNSFLNKSEPNSHSPLLSLCLPPLCKVTCIWPVYHCSFLPHCLCLNLCLTLCSVFIKQHIKHCVWRTWDILCLCVCLLLFLFNKIEFLCRVVAVQKLVAYIILVLTSEIHLLLGLKDHQPEETKYSLEQSLIEFYNT